MRISSEVRTNHESRNDTAQPAREVQNSFDKAFDAHSFREPNTSSPALMTTNEFLRDDTVDQIKISQNAPDGVIVSVGAGLTWILPELFSKLGPELILAFDYDLQVVFLGRLVVAILKEVENFEDFSNVVQNEEYFTAYGNKIIDKVENEDLKKLFESIDISSLRVTLLRNIASSSHSESRNIQVTDVIDHFKNNFEALKKLALHDQIAFVFADLLQDQTAGLLDACLGSRKTSKNNVVYRSNIQDYLGEKKLSFLDAIHGWHLFASSASGYTVESKLKTSRKNWLNIFSDLLLGK